MPDRAVRDLARLVRDELHARLWARAGQDPEFQAGMQEIWAGLAADDRAAWEADAGNAGLAPA